MRSCASISILKCAGPIGKSHVTLLQCQNKLSASPSQQRTISSYHRHHQSKILLYMDRIVRHWFVLHSKISFNTVKIQLIHSVPCATFFQIVSLTFSFFPLFKNFNYHIYLKNMYIKCLFSSNKIEELFYLPSDFVAHQFPIFALIIDPLIVCLSSKSPKSIQSAFPSS